MTSAVVPRNPGYEFFGNSYSLLFASRGANVVVNDFNAAAAQKVVDEIVKGMPPGDDVTTRTLTVEIQLAERPSLTRRRSLTVQLS